MAARRKRDPGRARAHAEFLSEAEEILERMREDLSAGVERLGAGSELPPELVNRLFRSAHSLKGLSDLFGHESLAALAHAVEDLLDAWRLGRRSPSAAGLALFDEVVACFARALGALAAGESEAIPASLVVELAARVQREGGAAPTPAAQASATIDAPPALLRALTEYEEHRLRENVDAGRGIYVIAVGFPLASFEERLVELSTALRESGEVLATLPSPGAGGAGQIRFSLLVASPLAPAALAARAELPETAVHVARAPSAGPLPVETPSRAQAPAELETLKSISATVRVDIKKLDELMNLVGDLGLERAALQALARRLSAEPASARLGAELEKIHKGFERKLALLQAGVLEVRMVPLRQVFEKLARVARRLRSDLGKQARLEITGADTELDKLIVEGLADPLVHIVRNAFDHAIEPPEERSAAGKPAEGTIRLEASQRGNDVQIAIHDDGRGIDPERVRRRALELGLISADQALSAKELLELVFAPGFSTRANVTETSGRGVGMDVVRTNLAALGGVARIDSRLGAGTTVTLTLPITLAILKALIVGCGAQRYAIPLNAVREVLWLDPAQLQRSAGQEILYLRGEALPLRRLRDEFELAGDAPDGKLFAVVLGMGDARLGLLVDRLEGQGDAVIKPIHGPLRTLRGIAGATEIGDQRAVLVLDVASFLGESARRAEAA
jgi:two-component system chemotaxis sensor kinase CheA